MKRQMWTGLLLMMAIAMPAMGEADCDVDALAWMVGQWRHCDASGCTQESWLTGQDERMLGVNQQWGAHDAFEFLRIESRTDALVYLAQPAGGPATTFVMTRCLEREVHFENKENDFPQRVVYRKDGDDALIAQIDGRQHGRDASMSWRWTRVIAD